MRKQFWTASLVTVAFLTVSSPVFADTFTFTLIPASGSISGAPGSVIGWGYSITNNSLTNFLEPLAVNAGLFQYVSLDVGNYFDFPLIAPGATVAAPFAAIGSTGFGAGLAGLTIAANAPIGFVNSGTFDLSACWANSAGTCISSAPDGLAPYAATVTATPEPSGAPLSLIVCVFLLTISVTQSSRGVKKSDAATVT